MLSVKRNAQAAQHFFLKVLSAPHTQPLRVINVDRDKAYPPAIQVLKTDEVLPQTTTTRQGNFIHEILGVPA